MHAGTCAVEARGSARERGAAASPLRKRTQGTLALFVRRLLVLLAFASCALSAVCVHAEEVRPFRYDLRVELPLLSVGALVWLTSELLKPQLAPAECRVCSASVLDTAVQQRARWSEVEAAHHVSDALLFGIVPAAAFASALGLGYAHGTRETAWVDALVVAESLVLAANLTQLTKYSVGRARPYVRTQRDEGRDFVASPDDHLSFFSGHTSATFALAVSAATTASLRGYREAPIVWAVAVPLAMLTGYLRIAADRHYTTDVLTGAIVGAAVGVLVPWLHAHGAHKAEVGTAQPGVLSLTWTN